jgi:transcriptional regulator with GAF, ATPase, and Fis domain
LDRQGIAVSAALPLLDGDELLGILHFLSGDSWSDELAQALSLLGGIVCAVLRENRRREVESRQRAMAELGEALSELTGQLAALSSAASIDLFLEAILERGIRLTGADEGSVILRDPSSGAGAVRVCAGYKSPITGMLVPEGAGITALVLKSGSPALVSDYQLFEGALPRIRQRGVRAALGVPMRGPKQFFGVLTLGTKRRDKRFTESDLAAAQALANLASLAVGVSPRS